MKKSTLFAILPDYISTPDGMAIDRHGNLVLSCPNFAEEQTSGCVVRFDREKHCQKWFDVPVHPQTGVARPMGIAFDRDYNLYICDNQGWSDQEQLAFQGRILRVTADEKGIRSWRTVASGMEHPNGVRIRGEYLYVTQSCMTRVRQESGLLLSAVYRFRLDEEDIQVTNTLEDPHLFATFTTYNPDCQYGADGIEFGLDGSLYVGNFGDGAVYRIRMDEEGKVVENAVFAQDSSQLTSTDGIVRDDEGNLYVADFSANAIAKVYPDGKVERIAQSPDCDGLDGGLDQPGEPILWDGRLVISCFDLVTDPGKVNTAHEMPATMAQLDL